MNRGAVVQKAILVTFLQLQMNSDNEFMFWNNLAMVSKKALNYLESFGEEFVRDNFYQNDFWEHHETWKDLKTDWILGPFIHVQLNNKIDPTFLATMSEEELLRNILKSLLESQMLLEAVTESRNDKYVQHFSKSSYGLKSIITEFKEFNKVPHLKIRKRKKGAFKKISRKEKISIMRDWVVYRDTRILLGTIVEIALSMADKKRKNRKRTL